MRFYILLIPIILFTFSLEAQEKPTGFSIIQKQHELSKGFSDLSADGTMLLKTKNGSLDTTRKFNYVELENTESNEGRLRITINYPPELDGTQLLSITQKDNSSEQYLYLPAIKQTKKIVSQSRGGRFLGSEFFFEDLIPYSWKAYDYTLIIETNYNNKPCYVIELKPHSNIQSHYGRILYTIEKERLITLKMDFYSAKSELIKVAHFEEHTLVNNAFWRPLKVTMLNKTNGRATELKLTNLQIKKGLTPQDLSVMKLGQ